LETLDALLDAGGGGGSGGGKRDGGDVSGDVSGAVGGMASSNSDAAAFAPSQESNALNRWDKTFAVVPPPGT
jgi:hypothetical protein